MSDHGAQRRQSCLARDKSSPAIRWYVCCSECACPFSPVRAQQTRQPPAALDGHREQHHRHPGTRRRAHAVLPPDHTSLARAALSTRPPAGPQAQTNPCWRRTLPRRSRRAEEQRCIQCGRTLPQARTCHGNTPEARRTEPGRTADGAKAAAVPARAAAAMVRIARCKMKVVTSRFLSEVRSVSLSLSVYYSLRFISFLVFLFPAAKSLQNR